MAQASQRLGVSGPGLKQQEAQRLLQSRLAAEALRLTVMKSHLQHKRCIAHGSAKFSGLQVGLAVPTYSIISRQL